MKKIKIMIIFGTRPETIKMAPLIKTAIERSAQFETIVVVTAQHREILDQPLALFGIKPDYDLNVMTSAQSLFGVSSKVLNGLETILNEVKPDVVLVQGDTTTTFIGSLAAYYLKIPVGHVEAGLRTYNKYNPFPEEINRKLTSAVAEFHFAPTPSAAECLLKEGIPAGKIFLTGNTVIDALHLILQENCEFQDSRLAKIDFDHKKIILLTTHRRESFGKPIEDIMKAIEILSRMNPDLLFVFPIHYNPNVRAAAEKTLKNFDQILIVDPLDYKQFVHLMARAHLILTDSGGIQEEATSLGKPTLILRETTERQEGVRAGTTRLVGTDIGKIVQETMALLNNDSRYQKMAQSRDLYGDGTAAQKILGILLQHADKLIQPTPKPRTTISLKPEPDLSNFIFNGPVKNILTVNVEEFEIFSRQDVILDIFKTLDFLGSKKTHATFFVSGTLAERYPEVISAIKDNGHEVSTQGLNDKLVYELSPAQFRQELQQAINVIQSITNEPVLGYRAPSYSIVRESIWAWDILLELGLRYDSSIFPVKHDRYGIPSAPRFPFVANMNHRGGLIEFPLSTMRIWQENIPIAGGGYLRYYPYWFIRKGIQQINAIGKPAVIYLRTWEIDPISFQKGNQFLGAFRRRANYAIMQQRINSLLEDFDFISIREILGYTN
jgi:UDP-N-acetylglucosamine 2-epimerase (non-hydrolysing)